MITVQRNLPANLIESDRELFSPHLTHEIPEPTLRAHHNVRASGMGILIKGLSLLPDAFPDTLESKEWSWESSKYNRLPTKLKLIAKSHLPGRRKVLTAPCLWCTDTWSLSYFFWLTETLSRLEFIRNELDAGWPLILPDHYLVVDFVKTALELFGIDNLVPVPLGWHYLLSEVHIPTRTAGIHHFNPDLVQKVGQRFRSANIAQPTGLSDKIHISRRKARIRKFINQDEVEAVFDHFGYSTVCMEDFSFREQVGMLTNARVLASIHGAGLANMLMMPPGSQVFEMRMRGNFNSSFFNLAAACTHPYYYQSCEPEKPNLNEQQNNFIADISLLRQNLERIEKARQP